MSEAAAALAHRVAEFLIDRNCRLISVESCTGGLLAAGLTELSGASEWFEGAFVTYRLSAKTAMVGVSEELLAQHGAVSEPVVRAMAEGGLANSAADVALAITGVAGPGGGDVITPVGTVWFAWATGADGINQTAAHQLTGNRQQVRETAVRIALEGLLELA